MLSDDAVEEGAWLARNSLFTLVLKTSKLYCTGNTLADRAFHSLHMRIKNDEPNRCERQGGKVARWHINNMSMERSHLVSRCRKVDGGISSCVRCNSNQHDWWKPKHGSNGIELSEARGFHTTFQIIIENFLKENWNLKRPGNRILDPTLSSRACIHDSNGALFCSIVFIMKVSNNRSGIALTLHFCLFWSFLPFFFLGPVGKIIRMTNSAHGGIVGGRQCQTSTD